jgi:lipopolysaccharide export system permease protein
MIVGRTLGTYFGWLFLRWFLTLYLGAIALVFLIDVLELTRDVGADAASAPLTVIAVSALRVPALAEQILPFAMLLCAIVCFLTLSRRLELVTARAAGLSVWQFAAPAVVIALIVGVVATTLVNPAATALKAMSAQLSDQRFSSARSVLDQASSPAWLRQRTAGGEAIMHVDGIAPDGATVLGPTFWMFDAAGTLERRVDASRAEIGDGEWRLSDARVVAREGSPETHDTFLIPTALTREQVRQRLAVPEDVSFWQLSATIAGAENAGLPLQRFEVHWHNLLARPLLLAAMVLIAATVSLGFSRQRNIGGRILIGVVSGFMLYVALQVSGDLGEAGLVPPLLAAWTPAFVATLLGVTVLLYREDG